MFFLCQVIVIALVQFPSTDRLLDRLQLTRNIHFENYVFQREQMIPKFKQDIAASEIGPQCKQVKIMNHTRYFLDVRTYTGRDVLCQPDLSIISPP